MGDNDRKVTQCHNCYLNSYEVLSKTKDTTTYLCRLCNSMEVIILLSGKACVRYKAIRTKIVVDNNWKTN
jgi:hypothetical protein